MRDRRPVTRLIMALVALVLFNGGAVLGQRLPAHDHVLLICSYHPGFPTFIHQFEGIRSVLAPAGVELDIEFMDSKRFGDAESIEKFGDRLAGKLAVLPTYDLVIVADDNALRFMLNRGPELLPGIPLVFMGINDTQLVDRAVRQPGVTGVPEAVSLRETLALMLSLLPEAERIVALVDATPSGQGDLRNYLSLQPEFPDHELTQLSLQARSFEEFEDELRRLDEGSAVLLLSAYVDSSGRRLQFDRSLERILAHLDLPLFHLWHHGLGQGILGGKVVSHAEQGRQAAWMAQRILAGESADSIPALSDSPNVTVIDHRVLSDHGLAKARLPGDAVLINKPESTLEKHRKEIATVAFILASQGLVIMFLVRVNRRLRQTRARLLESELRYSSLFAESHSVMMIIDPAQQGRILEVNDAACRFYGYSREQMASMTIAEINLVSAEELAVRMADASQNSRAHFESEHTLASGEVRDVEVHTGPIRLGGGDVLCSIVHDISRRRRAEADRESLVKRLQQAEKMEAIGTLAGGIAHDFNNILAVILGHTQLLLEDVNPTSPYLESLRTIEKSANKAGDLVQRILAFSRRSDIRKQTITPAELVLESLAMLRSTMPATIAILKDIDPDTGPIEADPTQLEQIIINLGTNAMHAMETTGGTLAVRLTRVDLAQQMTDAHARLSPGPHVLLSVQDTGPGIPAELQNEVFQPYFTTKDVGKGTGMGLSIIHGIVEQHGGAIELESSSGRGAEFRIYFPVVDSRENPPQLETESTVAGGPEHVLIVDDEEEIVDLADRIFRGLGYRTTLAHSGPEALEIFTTTGDQIDIVVTDLTMPGMTGLQLTRRLSEIRPDIPVILTTGYRDVETEKAAAEVGIRTVESKPLTRARYARVVRKVLDADR